MCQPCKWGGDASALSRSDKVSKKDRKWYRKAARRYHSACSVVGCTCQHRERKA